MVGGCYVRHVISVGWHREPPTDGKCCHVKVANHNATSSAIGPATAIEWSNERRAKSSRCSKRQPMSSPLSFSLCLFNKHIGCRIGFFQQNMTFKWVQTLERAQWRQGPWEVKLMLIPFNDRQSVHSTCNPLALPK